MTIDLQLLKEKAQAADQASEDEGDAFEAGEAFQFVATPKDVLALIHVVEAVYRARDEAQSPSEAATLLSDALDAFERVEPDP